MSGMDGVTLYEEDIYAWSQAQAEALRRLASAGLPLPNDLDLVHVVEEIEEVGNEQRFQAESNLIQALVHLIKMVALPEDQAVRHWRKETRAFLRNAARRYRPSMRRAIALETLWANARRDAGQDLADDGHGLPVLPETCPFTVEDLIDPDASVTALQDRLAAALPG